MRSLNYLEVVHSAFLKAESWLLPIFFTLKVCRTRIFGSSTFLTRAPSRHQNDFATERIRQTIKVDGSECWTLFDTGARNTYVIPSVAKILKTSSTPRTIRTALGGGVKETNTAALLEAEIQGHSISTHALVIEDIGKDEDGKPIEILFGALAMQQWGIRPIPDEERLDLSHYPEEFVEF